MIVVAVLLSIITVSSATGTKRHVDHDSESHHSTARLPLSHGFVPDSTAPTTRHVTPSELLLIVWIHIMSQIDFVTLLSSPSYSPSISVAQVSSGSNVTLLVYILISCS
jgi:hypothetical protein